MALEDIPEHYESCYDKICEQQAKNLVVAYNKSDGLECYHVFLCDYHAEQDSERLGNHPKALFNIYVSNMV